MPAQKFYALGMKGGFVEVRRAKTPPRKVISRAKVKGTRRKFVRYELDAPGGVLWDTVPHTFTLTQIVFKGGRSLKVVDRKRLRALGIRGPKPGEMIEMEEERCRRLLERS